jgi:glycogen synthase
MRKILMTADAVGGVWTYALELARRFSASGVETCLAVMGPAASDAQKGEARAIPGLDLRECDCKLEWMENPWSDVDRAGEWLLAIEREIAPAIIHLNGYAHASLPFRAPKLVVAHSCVLSWWRAVHGEPAPAEWNEYRFRVAAGLRSADAVIAPSRAMLAALHEHYGRLTRSRVIPNGVDPSGFSFGAKQTIILTAGRLWDPAKNVKLLEKIPRIGGWPMYAAGDGEIQAPVRALGRLGRAGLGEWFRRAAIFALPALYEPFGLSVLEAALSGCALVLGDIASLRENWDGAALFASPSDPRKFGAELRRLVCEDELRARLQRAARRRAAPFTAERMSAAYFDAYATLRARSQSCTAARSSTRR